MTIAETPEARKEASEEARPACANKRGAYFFGLVRFCVRMMFEEGALLKANNAYIEYSIDAAELLHAKQEHCQKSSRVCILGEDVKEAVRT